MKRGTIVLLIFALVAGGILLASQFLSSRPPLSITVAVTPLFADAARATASDFNERGTLINANRRVVVQITVIDDMDVWANEVNWTDGTPEHPAAWIPATSFSADYVAGDRRLPFTELEPSVAQTLLMWGGFQERVTRLTDYSDYGLDWTPVANSAAIGRWEAIGGDPAWQYLDLAFAAPDRSTAGMAVLLSGAAAYHDAAELTDAQLRDDGFRDWIASVITGVPNFSSLGSNPAQAIAQRGLSIADVALLPESQWVTNLTGLGTPEDFTLSYPAYPVVFDFPALLWDSPNVTADERAGAEAFIGFLMSETQQAALTDYGLRPAGGSLPTTGAALFDAAQPYGVQLMPDITGAVVAPGRSAMQSLLTWYRQVN